MKSISTISIIVIIILIILIEIKYQLSLKKDSLYNTELENQLNYNSSNNEQDDDKEKLNDAYDNIEAKISSFLILLFSIILLICVISKLE